MEVGPEFKWDLSLRTQWNLFQIFQFFLLWKKKKKVKIESITAIFCRVVKRTVAIARGPQKYTDYRSKWKTKQSKNETGSTILAVIKGLSSF